MTETLEDTVFSDRRFIAGVRDVARDAGINHVVNTTMRIGGIVAAVLRPVGGEHSDADRLQKLRDKKTGTIGDAPKIPAQAAEAPAEQPANPPAEQPAENAMEDETV